MLLRLARQDPQLHPDNPERRAAIYDKYRVRVSPILLAARGSWPGPRTSHGPLLLVQSFVIPEAEAEWVGLTLEEALEKQRLLEEKVSTCVPADLRPLRLSVGEGRVRQAFRDCHLEMLQYIWSLPL